MKATWKGDIAFGLITINVELYPAIKAHAIGFKLLHQKCKRPISYQRWCAHCEKEVSWQEIVKGLPLKDGSYFVMTTDTIKSLKPHKSTTIDIVEFVDQSLIDPVLYDTHYYVAPARAPYQAFFLFAAALENLSKVAIGQFILREKEHVAAIRSYHGALLLTTLNYAYEVKKLEKLEKIEVPKLSSQELHLAEQIIEKLSKKEFDIAQFKDTFATEIAKKVSTLRKGIPLRKKEKEEVRKAPKAKESLMNSLQASLKQINEKPRALARKAKKR